MGRFFVLFLVLLASCAPRAPRIVVQLVTDYVPVRDFDALRVTAAGHSESVAAAMDRSYGRAVRVLELEAPSTERMTISLTLLSGEDEVQTQPRRVLPVAGGTSVVTFLVTRDCAGISCPDAADAEAIACVGGLCVSPECSPEHPELCPTCAGGCTASPIACVESTCRPEGVCFEAPLDERCATGEACLVDEGCRALSTSFDAGLDAGADAFTPVDGGVDAFVAVDGGVDAFTPDAALPPDTIVQVASGLTATCVRLAGGTVQCTGSDSDGVLGMGSVMPRVLQLAPVPGVAGALDLRAGDTHMLVQTATGSLGWGWNIDAMLGTGSATPSTTSSVVIGTVFGAIRRLAPARTSTCVIHVDGSLQCVGDNVFGQLGDGTRTDSIVPRDVVGVADVTDIAGAEGHFCAVHGGGLVSCWGWGASGQLGNGSNTDSPTPVLVAGITDAIAVGVGQSHTCVARADGTLWCWGANDSGQLGDGTTVYRNLPAIVPGLSGVVEVVGGYVHTCARTGEGRIYCFGWNAYGQLGDGTTVDRSSPTLVMSPPDAIQLSTANGADFTCALHADHVVRCWGDNDAGSMGIGTVGESASVPVLMLPPT